MIGGCMNSYEKKKLILRLMWEKIVWVLEQFGMSK